MTDVYFNIFERRDGTLYVDPEESFVKDGWMSQDARAWVHVKIHPSGRRTVAIHDNKSNDQPR